MGTPTYPPPRWAHHPYIHNQSSKAIGLFTQQPSYSDAHVVLDPTFSPLHVFSQRLETWAVCTVVGGGRASAMALAEEHKHMKLIPWAGVAGRIGLTAQGDGDKVGASR